MKRATAEQLKAFDNLVKNNKRVVEFFSEWLDSELSGLPLAKDNVAQKQGRCQVLQEINNLLSDVPERNAAPLSRPTQTAHTDRSV